LRRRKPGALLDRLAGFVLPVMAPAWRVPQIAQAVRPVVRVAHLAELWRACVDAVYAAVLRHLDAAEPGIVEAEGVARLALAVRAHITATANPAFHRLLFQEAMMDSPRLRWLVETHQRPMSACMIAPWSKKRSSSACSPPTPTRCISSS
jgi:hypothetical protein